MVVASEGFFDLESPELFFAAIRRAAAELAESPVKSTERLMFVVMGLNHLREWIAPGYHHTHPADTPNKVFFNRIYKLDAFLVIQGLCNRSKHLKEFDRPMSITGSLPVDEWPDVDSVANFNCGPVPGYAVDGRDVMEIIDEVIQFYLQHWFSHDRSS